MEQSLGRYSCILFTKFECLEGMMRYYRKPRYFQLKSDLRTPQVEEKSSRSGNAMSVLHVRKRTAFLIILPFGLLFYCVTLVTVSFWSEGNPSLSAQFHDVEELLERTYHPWQNDPMCRHLHIGFIKNRSQPMMALASYPGSGNTWIRQMIERATGIFTGSVYEDRSIFDQGLYGEAMPSECGCTIVQKVHDFTVGKNGKGVDFNGSVILILRNPYNAIIAFRNLLGNATNHVHVEPENQFKGPHWNSFVEWEMINWLDMALTRIADIRKGGVIHYERFVANPSHEMRKLVTLMGLPVDEQRLECLLRHDPQHFKREHVRLSFDPFTRWHHQMIDAAIGEVQEVLQKYHFDPMPLHVFDYFNRSG